MVIKSHKGITLIELLIVVIVVGILAAIAVPIYTDYLIRARRADAKTALEQVRAAQEMYRAEKGCYAQDGINCQGEAEDGTAEEKLQNQFGAPSTSISPYYNWNFTVKTATEFTAQATPLGSQVKDGALFINHLGQKWDSDNKYYPEGKWGK